MAKEFGMTFFETSAKTGMNVDEAFMHIGQEIKNKAPSTGGQPANRPQGSIKVTSNSKDSSKKKGGCCKK